MDKELKKQIWAKKIELAQLIDSQHVLRYYNTMAQSGLQAEHYSYVVSNRSIPTAEQCAEHWVRAVIKHISERTHPPLCAELISIPQFSSAAMVEEWLGAITDNLRKAATKRITKKRKARKNGVD